MKVLILQLKTSNWRSVKKCLIESGIEVESVTVEQLLTVKDRSIIIIPGVGHIKSLNTELGSIETIAQLRNILNSRQHYVIGICLGFQFMCSNSEEDVNSSCLGLINSPVKRIYENSIPSVGWKLVQSYEATNNKTTQLAHKIESLLHNNYFYFTHSFSAQPSDVLVNSSVLYYKNEDNKQIVASIVEENYIGLQFHPEKSGSVGKHSLRAIIEELTSS